jgi:ATP-dependent Clp protease protease subunit
VSEELISVRDMLNGILSELTGKTPQEIEKASSYDHYFTAQESIDFGLADRIAGADALTGSL